MSIQQRHVAYRGCKHTVQIFASSFELRKWFLEHSDHAEEVWIGFYNKKALLSPSNRCATYAEALDQALCFGWIDGIRKKVDDDCYTNRFTPRKAKSSWSKINIARFAELKAAGLVTTLGQKAYDIGSSKEVVDFHVNNLVSSIPTTNRKVNSKRRYGSLHEDQMYELSEDIQEPIAMKSARK